MCVSSAHLQIRLFRVVCYGINEGCCCGYIFLFLPTLNVFNLLVYLVIYFMDLCAFC